MKENLTSSSKLSTEQKNKIEKILSLLDRTQELLSAKSITSETVLNLKEEMKTLGLSCEELEVLLDANSQTPTSPTPKEKLANASI